MARADRNSIFLEDGVVLARQEYPEQQFVMRVSAPKCAKHAKAGAFVHVRCDPLLPMRRPLSIMRTCPDEGWIELLFKIIGPGLARLSQRKPGELLSVLGPIGNPFEIHNDKPRVLMIGGGVGIPPMIFLADQLRKNDNIKPVMFMGSEIPFPFELTDSTLSISGVDNTMSRNLSLTEHWGIAGRLASLQDFEGCFKGYVTELADQWLSSIKESERDEVELFACGPTPMLKACAALAAKHNIPAQVSLEENMACAVGGCAGCTVKVQTPQGPAMKRVCVDGPVFSAETVF